jgi:glycosyltransferase involved in cell wall biosynthesis
VPEKMPLVSIVTPFYNTDEYLSECIESILAQTYENWEYILVNNCSSDRSAEIAQSYAKKDQRFRLIHNKDFLTQVQNYNHALCQISSNSKYCKVVQADDWIFPECLAKMVDVAEKCSSIGIISAFRLQGRKTTLSGTEYPNYVLSGKEACREQILYHRDYFGSPSTNLIRSEIIRHRVPFYNEHDLYEDTDACFEIMQNWNFGFVHQVLIFERTQENSLSSDILQYDRGWMLGEYIRILKFGPLYLSSDEYRRQCSNVKGAYFSFLAESKLFNREEKFWHYHKNGLARVGIHLTNRILLKYIIIELLDICLNIKKTVGRLLKHYQHRN